jgi:hypothetical protein
MSTTYRVFEAWPPFFSSLVRKSRLSPACVGKGDDEKEGSPP